MMKTYLSILAVGLCFTGLIAQNQKPEPHVLSLQNGDFVITSDVSKALEKNEITSWPKVNNKLYGIVKLAHYPTTDVQLKMGASGIEFLEAYRGGFYQLAIAENASLNLLNQYAVLAHTGWDAKFKFFKEHETVPSRVRTNDGLIRVNAHKFRNVSFEALKSSLLAKEFVILDERENYGFIELALNESGIQELATIPEVQFIDWAYDYGEPENYTGRTSHRVNVLSGENTNGIAYEGQGVAVMMQDDGAIGPHIDQHGRVYQKWPVSTGDHGDHVSGTITGAGNLNPLGEGQAKQADMYVYKAAPEYQGFDSIWTAYYDYDLVITSTSYSNGCNAGYTALARTMDDQVQQLPALMHVFSAGNSGTSNCGYGAGNFWGNITGGHKVGKNVMTVANLDADDNIANSSSRGPAHDGRIKPDISAKGTQVFSTIGGYTYDVYTGTSMSCPGVSGTMAVLYSAYQDINGSQPEGGLMKAIALNTADDLGNPGPDFIYGWGRINARKAYSVIENTNYTSATLSNGDSTTIYVSVPPGASHAKIMIYWTDPEASINASTALINDLDMTITTPSLSVLQPLVLDPTPNATTLASPAVPGEDHLNNVEQIVIDSPEAGTYAVKIKGYDVPQGPQKFFLVSWMETPDLVVTYPIGGESFVPFSTEKLRWDVHPDTGTVKIEYSTNGGSTWNTVVNSVNASEHHYDWSVPNVTTGKLKFKFTYGGTEVETGELSAIATPTGLTVTYACPDSIGLNWDDANNATSYDIYKLGNKYMDSIGVSTTSDFVDYLSSPFQDSLWYSVSSNGSDGAEGKRAVAINHPAGLVNCVLAHDAGIFNLSPGAGTFFDCHGDSAVVSFQVINHGTNPITSLDATANNDASFVLNETFSLTLAPGDTELLVFAQMMPINPSGDRVFVEIDLLNDANSFNDSTSNALEVATGSSLSQAVWSEDFESFINCSTDATCGLVDCNLFNGWTNEENYIVDDADWRTNQGSTPSSFTGPSTDHTTGGSAGKYLYVEASECFNQEALLLSPCIDLAPGSEPVLSFWYNMFGVDMGSLNIDVFDGTSWHLGVFTLEGFQNTSWDEAVVDLSNYAGTTINIRFRALTGAGYRSDIAIDDINVLQPPVANFDFNVQNDGVSINLTDLSQLADTMVFELGDGTVLDYVPTTHTYGSITVYSLTQTVMNNAGSDTLTKDLVTLSVEDFNQESYAAYPNPASNELFIQLPANSEIESYSIHSVDGTLIELRAVQQSSLLKIEISQLSAGAYFVKLKGYETVEIPFIKVQ